MFQVSTTWCLPLSPVRSHTPSNTGKILNAYTQTSLRLCTTSILEPEVCRISALALGSYLASSLAREYATRHIYTYVKMRSNLTALAQALLLSSLLRKMEERVSQRCACLFWYLARSSSQWDYCEIDASISVGPNLIYVSWYGWSAQAKVQFMMPIVGTAIFGFGIMIAS